MDVYKKKTVEELNEELNMVQDKISRAQDIIQSVNNECGVLFTDYGVRLIDNTLRNARLGILSTKGYLKAHLEELEPAKDDEVIIEQMEATDE